MTALTDFQRLESTGVWRESPVAQRRDVIVSIGDATLTLSDQHGVALVHWSLPAVERINPGERPALFRPGPDAADILEISDDTMIRANTTVQTAIERRRPHPGRLRFAIVSAVSALFAALVIFWLPRAMVEYTASVVPASKRVEIGEKLLANIRRISGKTCNTSLGTQSLAKLQTRLFRDMPGRIVVLSGGVKTAQHLPGHITLLNRALVEDFEDVAVAAGFVIAEDLRQQNRDPLLQLLRSAGLLTSFHLLTTGNISDKSLAQYAETLLSEEIAEIRDSDLLAGFARAGVRATPYAYAVDISGETTIGLIEADPVKTAEAAPLLSDGDWVILQGICGE